MRSHETGRPREAPLDRSLSWRPPIVAVGGALGMYAFFQLLSSRPLAADRISAVIDTVLTRPLSLATGLLPFSVIEVLLAGYLVWIASRTAGALRSALGGRRRWRNVLTAGAQRVLRDAGIVVIVFYAAWGLNYAGPDFTTRAGWPAWDGMEVEELTALAEAVSEEVNAAYLEVHGTPDAGVPTAIADARALEAAVDSGWARAAEVLSLRPNAAARYGRVKRPLSSHLLLRLGIAGIYSPFTAEAHLPRGVPAIGVPMTMAHEKAHQRGVTGEGDASFLAFVAAGLAPDPLSRYSAALYAQNQFLLALRVVAPEVWERILDDRLPGVQRDVDDRRAFAARFQGTIGDVGTLMNDRYLRTHRVAAGVGDYRRSAQLIVQFARQQGGQAMPGARLPAAEAASEGR